ncbi:MAG TPA: ABC transporter permease [Thermoanaerobaculia bacterium]|nr:ABC transporter permease [Thermoanaerobaculia bacterium]
MFTPETFETAMHRFRTHPVQMALTLAGLVVGTAAIIIIVALGLTGRTFVMSQIEGVGSHLVWASYEGTVTSGVSRTTEDQITDADVRAIEARSDLFSGVTPLVELHGTVSVLSRAADLSVLGTTPNYATVRKNLRILRGRFLDDDDISERAKVCVVSHMLYHDLFGNDTLLPLPAGEGGGEGHLLPLPAGEGGGEGQLLPLPAGEGRGEGHPTDKMLRTLGMTFQVVGEFDKPVDTMGQGEITPYSIFVPVTVAWFFTPSRRVDTVFAEVREFSEIPRAAATVEDLLRDRHHQGSVFKVKTMTTVIRVARTISFGLIAGFIAAAAVSVVVGGVGIMNILLASVEQRTREIGVRMSVGARRRDILRQFLLEALMLGAMGSLLGVVVGLGLPLLVKPFVHGFQVRVSPLSALLAFLFSCGVTIVFGVVPAVRAANLNPTEALRYE